MTKPRRISWLAVSCPDRSFPKRMCTWVGGDTRHLIVTGVAKTYWAEAPLAFDLPAEAQVYAAAACGIDKKTFDKKIRLS